MEDLERRLLMRAPRPVEIASAYLDNRGQAFFTVTVALDPTTLSRKTAAIYGPGVDGQFGTADDVRLYTAVGYRKGRLSLRANLALNTAYRVKLNAAVIKDVNGRFLDGEFNGNGRGSGDAVQGGNYDVVTTPAAKQRVRFTTVQGYINVGLYNRTTPGTVANFLHYANEGAWDTTIIHRSEHNVNGSGLDVIQGGGFDIGSGTIDVVHSHAGINLELGNSNVQGTIAMARTQALNSATNQWFFNTKANTVLDTTGGGYAVFGAILDAESLATITAINNFSILNASSILGTSFGELPVLDPNATTQNLQLGDLVAVTRVAQLFDAAATPNVGAATAAKGNVAVTGGTTNTAPMIRDSASAAVASPFFVTKGKNKSLFEDGE